ncbi:MAG: hypothetical protein QXP04_04660, partial [Candidatus Nanoarchaeia archaeon]|nr:hypothetical protein [Candidatus Jingweiarchaeum tengchongense]
LIVYPGSLEYCDVREMESDAEKGFYIVEVDNGKTSLKWIKVKVRKIMVRKLNCNNLSAHEATENCLKLIREEAKNLENGVLILKLEGRLKSGSRGEIDRTIIEKVSKEFGVLITQVYVSDLLDPTSAISIDIRSKSLEQIEQEYLERQKYDTKMIKVARELISILGQELGGDEIEREVNKACEIIEKEILQ